jgi:hypothetical protein
MAALETSASMVYRVRKQLVEEGLEAALSREQRATPAVAPIFDGEREAELIAPALAASTNGRPEIRGWIGVTQLTRRCIHERPRDPALLSNEEGIGNPPIVITNKTILQHFEWHYI